MRLLYIHQSHDISTFSTLVPGLDSDVYWRAAALLNHPIAGLPNWEILTTTSPFFVWWLSLVQKVLGESVYTYRLFLAFVSPLNAVVVYLLAAKLLRSRLPAVCAALLFAAAPVSLHFDTIIAKPNLEIPLFAAVAVILLVLPRQVGRRKLLLTTLLGAMVAVLCLVQFATIVLVPVVVLILWYGARAGKKKPYRLLVGIMASFLLLFTSATVLIKRNLPARPLYGFNTYLAWNSEAQGVYKQIDQIPTDLFGHAFYSHMLAQDELGKTLTPAEANDHFLKKALSYVLDHPGDAMVLLLRKAELFFNSTENKTEEYLPFLKSKLTMLQWNPVNFGLFLLLGVFGLRHCMQKSLRYYGAVGAGLFLAVFLLCLLVMPTWRYRYPALLPLSLLSAGGLIYLANTARDLRRRTWKNHTIDLAILLIVTFLTYRSVHSEKYLQETFQTEEHNLVRANARNFWLAGRPLTQDLGATAAEDQDQVNRICNYHFYSYCYARARELLGAGKEDVSTARWYLAYEIYQGAYEDARNYLEHLRISAPEMYRNITAHRFSSPLIDKLLNAHVFSPSQKNPQEP